MLTVRVGRSTDNDLVINKNDVSEFHFELVEDKDVLKIINRSKSSGTAVNGRFIEEKNVKLSDTISFGRNSYFVSQIIELSKKENIYDYSEEFKLVLKQNLKKQKQFTNFKDILFILRLAAPMTLVLLLISLPFIPKYISTIVPLIIGFIAYKQTPKLLAKKKKKLVEKFRDRIVCPNSSCGQTLVKVKVLSEQTCCPHKCGAQFQ